MKETIFLFFYLIHFIFTKQQILITNNLLLENKIKENNICEKKKDFMRKIYCYPNIEDESLLENEPIDVVIKYIDLFDNTLIREGIPQFNKDYENGEIKYCIRSILKYIPWVNKIFILMPNEKVKFFKDYEKIKEKIIYVKDKDVLGFDSAASPVFEFNLWRLKNFGLSENFIYFNDDYFVGNYLKKSDFFYVENNKVVPYILGKKSQVNRESIQKYYNIYYNIISKREKLTLDTKEYFVRINGTRLFIYKLFGDNAKIIGNNHNALPDNYFESEEIYNIILNKHYNPNASLKAIFRDKDQLIYQEFRINYLLNKYNRKIKNLKCVYNDIRYKINDADLYVVNTGGGVNYKDNERRKSFIQMNYKLPTPSKYEIIEIIKDGYYILETELKNNLVINFGFVGKKKKRNVLYLNTKKNRASEVFFIKYQNDNSYLIKSVYGKKFLGVNKENIKKVKISFDEKNEGNKVKWLILPNLNNYFIISQVNLNCILSVKTFKSKNYSKILCEYPNGKDNQLFKLIPVED